MTDHKFTDAEVIKALDCCINTGNPNSCQDCCFHNKSVNCVYWLEYNALDLINRQRAEIEKYKDLVNADVVLVRRLNGRGGKSEAARQLIRIKTNLVKAEAIKEFAERLHKHIDDFREKREMVMLPYTEAALLCIEKKIDDLVKEMTEGEET